MTYLVQIDHLLRRIEFAIALVALVVIVVSTAAGVFSRSVLGAQIIWTSELSLLAQVWLAFIGASAVFKERGHVGVSGIAEALPASLGKYVVLVRDLVLAGLMTILGLAVFDLLNLQWEQSMSTLRVPRAVSTLPVLWAIFSIAFSAVASALVAFWTPDSSGVSGGGGQ